MDNMLMQGGPPPQGPQGQPPGQPMPDQAGIADARAHMGVVRQALMGLAQQPRGSLTKQAVFNAMGEAIAQGAFSTPQAKQQLVAEMAQVPDDEAAIRQMIGSHLLRMTQMQAQFHQHFGAE